jgi:hypothetical protein
MIGSNESLFSKGMGFLSFALLLACLLEALA